jgi:neutral trehalase
LKVSEEFVQVKLKLQIEEKKKEEEKNIKVRQDIEGLKKIMRDEERIGLEEMEKLELEIKDEDGKIRGKELAIQQMRAKLETPGGMSKDVRSTSSSRTGCMDCAIF